MAKITRAMQIAEYCENLRREMGIETTIVDYDKWNTMRITDSGLFQFYNDKDAIALYGLQDMVSAESARKLGGRQYKKSMNEYLVGVYFYSELSETSMWNHINGKNIRLSRVYSTSIKLVPIADSVFQKNHVISDAGLFEINLTAGEKGEFKLVFEDIPKTGVVSFPLRMHLSGGLPAGPVNFEYKACAYHFECGGEKYFFSVKSISNRNERSFVPKIEAWRARKAETGSYLDVIMSFDYYR